MSVTATPTRGPAGAATPDWLADAPSVPRGRVVRRAAVDASVRLERIDLPTADELRAEALAEELAAAEAVTDDHDEADDSERGARAVAWALAYQNGFEAGHAEGFEAGRAAGLRSGHDEATREAFARYDRVLDRLERTATQHLDELQDVIAAVATQATELGFEIARAVLARELATAADPGAEAIRRALSQLPGTSDVVARLHPDDLARLSVTTDEVAPGRALQLVADATVERGDCHLSSGAATIDASVTSALARVRAVLELPTEAVTHGAEHEVEVP